MQQHFQSPDVPIEASPVYRRRAVAADVTFRGRVRRHGRSLVVVLDSSDVGVGFDRVKLFDHVLEECVGLRPALRDDTRTDRRRCGRVLFGRRRHCGEGGGGGSGSGSGGLVVLVVVCICWVRLLLQLLLLLLQMLLLL